MKRVLCFLTVVVVVSMCQCAYADDNIVEAIHQQNQQQCVAKEANALKNLEEIKQKLGSKINEIYALDTGELEALVGECCDEICIIDAQELQRKITSEQPPFVVNVLSKQWYDDCHIQGSINIPLKELLEHVEEWDKKQEIVVYCALSSCNASEKACVLLKLLGFEHVAEYQGGIKEWFQLKLPVEGPCASSYLREMKVQSATSCLG